MGGIMRSKMRRFLQNAIFMALAALFMRTVNVYYHAFLSTSIGAEGMGLFALVVSIQGFAITFATSGVQLAVTRLVSESLGRGEYAAARGALKRGTIYALCFSGVACLILFFGAPFFGRVVLGDSRTILSLRILAFSLPPFALCAVFNGYFMAVSRVWCASAIQVMEQGIRIFTTLYLVGRAAPYGLTHTCAAVVMGATVAQGFTCISLFIRFLLDRYHLRGNGGDEAKIRRKLLGIALPVAASSYIRSGLLTIEHILIPRALVKGGRRTKEEALSSYGILDGMALPVVFYPMAILSSFSGLLIPVFAEYRAKGEGKSISYVANRALHLTTIFALGCTACLCVFSRDLGIALFQNADAGEYICLLSAVIPLMFLDHVTDCALKGLGEQVYTMWVNIADSALSIVLVVLLLPTFGAIGYVYVIFLAELFNFTLSFARLCHVTTVRYSFLRSLVFPGIVAVFTVWFVRLLFRIDPMTATVPWVVGEMIFAAAVYVGFLALLSIIGKSCKGKGRACLDIL